MSLTTSPGASSQNPPAAAPLEAEPVIHIGHGELLRAIEKTVQENSVNVQIDGLGTVRLPALDSLAWIGGLATLAAVGLLDWPVAAVLGVGHVLARQHHLRVLEDFGQAIQTVG